MREIKFRAWEEVNKVMHLDFRFIKSGDEGNDWLIFTSDKQTLQDKHHPFDNPWFQQQFKIMQYTGLKDANGVEIYEGDIARIAFDDGASDVFQIVYKAPSFRLEGFGAWSLASEASSTEVIGNIYQNPELLNG